MWKPAGHQEPRVAGNKPRFKLGDKVRTISPLDGEIGTIARVPKRISTGLLYGGDYAYDVEFINLPMQRMAESNLSPVSADLEPRFKLGDKVLVLKSSYDHVGKIGTVLSSLKHTGDFADPAEQAFGLLFHGATGLDAPDSGPGFFYTYDVEFSDDDVQRMFGRNLSPVIADSAKAGGK